MKWIFLFFLFLLAAVGNIALLQHIALLRLFGVLAFNVFIFGLFLIWSSSYSYRDQINTRGKIFGHALIMFAAGIALICLGVDSTLSDSCDNFIFSRRSNILQNKFVFYIQSLGFCSELGVSFVLLGLFVAYPSIRLFLGLSKNPSQYL